MRGINDGMWHVMAFERDKIQPKRTVNMINT